MEKVCLNREPVFEEDDRYGEDDGECSLIEHDNETGKGQTKREPPQPTIGLEFESFDEVYNFYNAYGKKQGFGVRVSNSWFRSKRKERYRAKLSCSSAGFKRKSEANHPRPETRTGCPAMIVIKLINAKRWKIVEVELEHNHPLSPDSNRFYKSHKKMIVAAKNTQQSEPVMEIHTIKLYKPAALDHLSNGFSETDPKECTRSNHSQHLELKGDSHAVYNYFCRMKLTNPNFFYSMDLDHEGQLRNMFWADARSRTSCAYFCDTILIDTTCLVNKFEIPLILFVGMNNHGQSVLLGCGFIGYESVQYFTWMFKTWVTCMFGCSPKVIITDQSKPLEGAVSTVFPNASHCYSLWYIIQRIPEKLGGLRGFEFIKRKFNIAVYDSLTISEFESSWGDMIGKHGLVDNKWLQILYENRQKWAPVYLKDVPFVGMLPVKEDEGFSPFFDGYAHKHATVKEFVDKYDLALHRKYLKEAMEDLESTNLSSELRTNCNFELQLSKIYTKQIFKKFQTEVEGMYTCFNTRKVGMNGPIMMYIVKERVEVEGGKNEVRSFEVLFETTQVDVRCICSLFNFKGYLCRHALNVLKHNGVQEIPSRYILARWRKDLKRGYGVHNGDEDIVGNDREQWYNNLHRRLVQVVEEGAQSRGHYRVALQGLEELLQRFHLEVDSLY